MRSFQFRLERVMRLRRQQVEAARRALAEALAAEAGARQGLAAVRAHKAAEVQRAARCEAGGLPVADFAAWRRHLGAIARVEEQAVRDLAAAGERVAGARAELLERRRKAQVLENLRDRRYEQFRVEAGRAEQTLADELAVLSGEM